MKQIVTLTLNPSIDGACETDLVRATHRSAPAAIAMIPVVAASMSRG